MSEDGTYLVPVVVAGNASPSERAGLTSWRFPLEGGINGLAATRREVIWTEDYLVDPRVPHEPDDQETAKRLGLRRVLVAPLRGPEAAILGTLAVSSRTPGGIGPEAIELLQGLADQASLAVANGQLYERLRASEARYRFLVEASPDVIWQADTEGRFTYVSETSLALSGWPAEELIGQHFAVLIDEADLPMVVERWEETQRDPDSLQHYRFQVRTRDGRADPGGAPCTRHRGRRAVRGGARLGSRRQRSDPARARPARPGCPDRGDRGARPPRARAARLGDPGAVQHDAAHPQHRAACSRATRRRPGRSWPPSASCSATPWPRCAR